VRRRPLSIAITGWLFVLTGLAGILVAAYRLGDPATRSAAPPHAHHLRDFAWAAASGVVSLAGGAFALRGRAWARWALAAWMAGHVVLSAMHSMEQLAVHSAIFAPLACFLFGRAGSKYFRWGGAGAPTAPAVGDPTRGPLGAGPRKEEPS
jgi:hypothetical protein